MIAMNRNERSVYSVFSDRIEAYSVIELTEIHGLGGVGQKTYVASGRVTDIGGHGVGGVKIIFSGGYVGTTVTDSEGRWKAYSLTIGAIRSHLQRLQA